MDPVFDVLAVSVLQHELYDLDVSNELLDLAVASLEHLEDVFSFLFDLSLCQILSPINLLLWGITGWPRRSCLSRGWCSILTLHHWWRLRRRLLRHLNTTTTITVLQSRRRSSSIGSIGGRGSLSLSSLLVRLFRSWLLLSGLCGCSLSLLLLLLSSLLLLCLQVRCQLLRLGHTSKQLKNRDIVLKSYLLDKNDRDFPRCCLLAKQVLENFINRTVQNLLIFSSLLIYFHLLLVWLQVNDEMTVLGVDADGFEELVNRGTDFLLDRLDDRVGRGVHNLEQGFKNEMIVLFERPLGQLLDQCLDGYVDSEVLWQLLHLVTHLLDEQLYDFEVVEHFWLISVEVVQEADHCFQSNNRPLVVGAMILWCFEIAALLNVEVEELTDVLNEENRVDLINHGLRELPVLQDVNQGEVLSHPLHKLDVLLLNFGLLWGRLWQAGAADDQTAQQFLEAVTFGAF